MPRGLPLPELHSHGEGAPVLMLHGLGATSAVFDGVRRALGPGFRSITVDLPHHGRGAAWSLLEPTAVAQKLSALIDEPDFYILGHSFGGVAALELLSMIPQRVRGVCAVAAPAMGLSRLSGTLQSRLADWTMRIAAHVRPSPGAIRTYLRFIRGRGSEPTVAQIQDYLLAMEAEGHHAATLQALRALAKYQLPVDALRRSNVPIALVFGEQDPLVPLNDGRKLAEALSIPVDALKLTGHCIPEERPEELATIVRREHARGEAANAANQERWCFARGALMTARSPRAKSRG